MLSLVGKDIDLYLIDTYLNHQSVFNRPNKITTLKELSCIVKVSPKKLRAFLLLIYPERLVFIRGRSGGIILLT